MKTSLFLAVTIAFFLPVSYGQTLSQYYNNETLKLEEVSGFAEMNNWNDLFSDYHSEWNGKEIGKLKHIVVAPDGSVFMSHHTHYDIWKFDKDGRFIKRFGSKGSGKGQFHMLHRVEGILGGKYVYTTGPQGWMLFFDLDGNYVKSMKLDYMPLRTVPLNDMKIAIFGHVPWKNHTVKKIIAIKDFETGREKTVWYEIYDHSADIIELPNGKKMITRLNFNHPSITRFGIATASNGNLLIALHSDGAISEYLTDGEKINSFPLNIKPVEITDADVQRIYQAQINAIPKIQERLPEHRRLTDEELDVIEAEYEKKFESVKSKIRAGDHLPIYSTVIMDSDGNILVFEFTEEKDSNRFRAYSYNQDGTLIGVSSFESQEYDLAFTDDTFVFHDGYIYAIATKRNTEGIPLRLVKFKLLKEGGN